MVGFTPHDPTLPSDISVNLQYARAHIAAVTSVAGTKGIGQLASYSSSKKYPEAYRPLSTSLAGMQNLDIHSLTSAQDGYAHPAA